MYHLFAKQKQPMITSHSHASNGIAPSIISFMISSVIVLNAAA